MKLSRIAGFVMCLTASHRHPEFHDQESHSGGKLSVGDRFESGYEISLRGELQRQYGVGGGITVESEPDGFVGSGYARFFGSISPIRRICAPTPRSFSSMFS